MSAASRRPLAALAVTALTLAALCGCQAGSVPASFCAAGQHAATVRSNGNPECS